MLSRQEQIDLFYNALNRGIRRGSQAYFDLLDKIQDPEIIELLINSLSSGTIASVLEEILGPPEGIIGANINSVAEEIVKAYTAASKIQVRAAAGVYGPQGVVEVAFADQNPFLRMMREQKFAQKVVQTRDAVKMDIFRAVQQQSVLGINPRDAAREFRDKIGLTQNMEGWVANYRRNLDELSMQALARDLRDHRSDARVRRAIRDGQPLDPEYIDTLVAKYKRRIIKWRSEMIARTEMTHAMNEAKKRTNEALVRSGAVTERQIRRFWHYTHDGKTRDEHVAVPAMNPQGVGLNERFQTPLGPLMYPGDPAGTAHNVINCRCTEFTRFVSQELLDDDPDPTRWVKPVEDARSEQAMRETTE